MCHGRRSREVFSYTLAHIGVAIAALTMSCVATADDCYSAMVKSPSPFMGNDGEIVVLDDGSVWEVKYEYEYMYEYYPSVMVCPAAGKLIVDDKVLSIAPVRKPKAGGDDDANKPRANRNENVVVLAMSGCRGYFIADGLQGYYLLQWYGGYEPEKGDTLLGDISGYGFKDVYYPQKDRQGRVYVDNYLLSRDRVLEKYAEKCN